MRELIHNILTGINFYKLDNILHGKVYEILHKCDDIAIFLTLVAFVLIRVISYLNKARNRYDIRKKNLSKLDKLIGFIDNDNISFPFGGADFSMPIELNCNQYIDTITMHPFVFNDRKIPNAISQIRKNNKIYEMIFSSLEGLNIKRYKCFEDYMPIKYIYLELYNSYVCNNKQQCTQHEINIITELNKLTSEMNKSDGMAMTIESIFKNLQMVSNFNLSLIGLINDINQNSDEPKKMISPVLFDFFTKITNLECVIFSLNNSINNYQKIKQSKFDQHFAIKNSLLKIKEDLLEIKYNLNKSWKFILFNSNVIKN